MGSLKLYRQEAHRCAQRLAAADPRHRPVIARELDDWHALAVASRVRAWRSPVGRPERG